MIVENSNTDIEIRIVFNLYSNKRLELIESFIKEYCKNSIRENKINDILNASKTNIYIIDETILGSIYQSNFRCRNERLIGTGWESHIIKGIKINNDNTYIGLIETIDTPSGRYINTSDKVVILRPIYSSEGQIITFDIDFIKTNRDDTD